MARPLVGSARRSSLAEREPEPARTPLKEERQTKRERSACESGGCVAFGSPLAGILPRLRDNSVTTAKRSSAAMKSANVCNDDRNERQTSLTTLAPPSQIERTADLCARRESLATKAQLEVMGRAVCQAGADGAAMLRRTRIRRSLAIGFASRPRQEPCQGRAVPGQRAGRVFGDLDGENLPSDREKFPFVGSPA